MSRVTPAKASAGEEPLAGTSPMKTSVLLVIAPLKTEDPFANK
jgi:hypothetical protein